MSISGSQEMDDEMNMPATPSSPANLRGGTRPRKRAQAKWELCRHLRRACSAPQKCSRKQPMVWKDVVAPIVSNEEFSSIQVSDAA